MQYGHIAAVLNTTKTNTRIRIFHTRFELRYINYSSHFIQHPHYPIACCLPHLSAVTHNCLDKSINLTAKRITSPCGKKKKTRGKKRNLMAKEKDSKQKENLMAKRKRLTAKFLRYREDILILISFAVRLHVIVLS